MPLLEVVGVSSFNTSFYSCFVALQREETKDYIWALERFRRILSNEYQLSVIIFDRELALINAIEVVFPSTRHLLCIWHIEKNILSKCKQYFGEKEEWDEFLSSWTNLIKSPDQFAFEEALKSFEVNYSEKYLVLDYLRNTWLPLKEKFVYAWAEKYLHFGNHVSSRVEAAHAMLKKHLRVSTTDFLQVKDKIRLAIENQFQEIKARLASERIRIPHKFHIPLFEKLLSHVSVFALEEIYKQYKLACDGEFGQCRGHFQSSMGLPCAHKIREKKDGILELDDIHPQWRIDTRSFNITDRKEASENDQILSILEDFQVKY